MNSHLNLHPEFERKLALSLASLTPETERHDQQPSQTLRRRLILPLFLAALMLVTATWLILPASGLFQSGAVQIAPTAQSTAASSPAPDSGKPLQRPAPAVAHEVTGSGFVVAPRMTTIFAKYEGRVTHIAVNVGERVEKGAVLVTLEDAGAAFAQQQAYAAKNQADLVLAARDIDLAQARTALTRTESLARRDVTSRQVLEEAQAAVQQAENASAQALQAQESAKLAIMIAEERLAELTVRAPLAGTVTRLDAHVGDTILARADSTRENQSLLAIADMTSLVIDADVAETNIAALRQGLHGEAVLDGFPGQPFPIEVLRLAPIASAEKGTITLRLSLDNPPEGIRPNMAARIRIPLDHTGDTTR